MIFSEAVEAGARVLDPEAFELPLRGYTDRAAAQARADARRMSRRVLEAAARASVPKSVDGQVAVTVDESTYDHPTVEDAGSVSLDAIGALHSKTSRRVLCPTCRGHLPPDYCDTCDNTGKVKQGQVA